MAGERLAQREAISAREKRSMRESEGSKVTLGKKTRQTVNEGDVFLRERRK